MSIFCIMEGNCFPKTSGLTSAASAADPKIIYWHKELPPIDSEAFGEHVVEAASHRVSGVVVHRDEVWERCFQDLMTQAARRLEQEVARLGGHYAHVLDESIDSRHDDKSGEGWLHGRFTYMLYKRLP